jgi:NAD(P)-dependent dehydrogenase (short-subunit alcohol dehydrogenase family)
VDREGSACGGARTSGRRTASGGNALILDLFRLDGRAAVVTGSGRGIGAAIAVAFAEAGADVVVTARRADDVAAVAAQVRERGRRAIEFPADLRTAEVPAQLAQAAVNEFGHLDVWVNNAGGTDERGTRPLTDTSDAQLRDMLELNLIAAQAGAREAARRMTRGGAIVNVASGAGMRAAPNTGAYAAAKAALLNLTFTMAAELARHGVRVNAISPGMVPTDSFYDVLQFTADDLPKLVDTVPLGRLGTPQDMAAAVLYLSSPAASWVTGQNLLIGGGRDGGRSVEHR